MSLVFAFAVTSSAAADGVPFQPGDVLAGVGNGLIKHFDANGNLLDTLDTKSGSSEDTGMCFDQAGNLYTTNFQANTVSKFDKNGNLVASAYISSGVFDQSPESCVFNSAGQMFVGEGNGTHVFEFDSSGHLINTFSPAPQDRGTDWIDLAADQHTLHYTSEGTAVKQFDVGSNTQGTDFATGLPGPCFAHRILPDGGEMVACSREAVRLDSSGAIVKTYPLTLPSGGPPGLLFALNLDPDGTTFWTADLRSGQIWRVNIASGAVVTTFNAATRVDVAGLAVVGELTAAQDAKPTATGAPVHATEGSAFSGTVATFSDSDSSAKASDYSATINWGDGSSSAGTITGSGGSFTVSGTHTYSEEGSPSITVTITDTDSTSNTATATSNATIADAALQASGVSFSSGRSVSGPVASFTDNDSGGTVSDYTASINWGDGATSAGTVAARTGGFSVRGSHRYSKAGKYTITTTIKDSGGSTATATSTVTIRKASVKAASVAARLSNVPTACVSSAFTASVQGKRIDSVKFTLDGRRFTTRRVRFGRQFSAVIAVSPGHHTLTVTVKFHRGSAASTRTFRRAVIGCPAPSFTG